MENIKKNKKNKFLSVFIGIICVVISVICLAIIAFNFSHSYSAVIGVSMSPTLNKNGIDEDYVFISKTKTYTYGDIVVATRLEGTNTKKIVKRLIAQEYDKIKIELDSDKYVIKVIYKGQNEASVLNEQYLKGEYTNEYIYNDFKNYLSSTAAVLDENGFYEVPANSVFLLGDNRNAGESYDSADYGAVDADSVIGKVDYVVYGGKWRYIQVIKQLLKI